MNNPECSLVASPSPCLLNVFPGFGVLRFSAIFAYLAQLQTFDLYTPQWKGKPEA